MVLSLFDPKGGPPLRLPFFISLLFFTGACSKEETGVENLSPREQLIRLSMDLRGRHPSEEDLRAIDENPSLYEAFVDRYLESPYFPDRMMEIFNLSFQTRNGKTYYTLEGTSLENVDPQALARSVGDEPLRLIRYIVENDLPYSEIVTAPYTLADPLLAEWWNIDYPAEGVGWEIGTYRDGRPHAGILSQTTFWHRYPSMGGNANRHRANAISRILLCDDFLSRPIVLNRTAIDLLTGDPEDAIRTSDTCQSCHVTLDPLAANLFGFFRDDMLDDDLEAGRVYQPENEQYWKAWSGRAPGYFGKPTANLQELGEAIAEDPRFVDCAVRSVFEGITQRGISDDDWEELQAHRETFEASGLKIKALVRSIVLDETYRARAFPGDPDRNERIGTLRMASPRQLAQVIEDATGYRWTFSGADALADNARGLAVLAGGIDSVSIRTRAENPSVGLVFVQERLAQAAAWAVVEHDFDPDRDDAPRLFCCVGPKETPQSNPEAFRTQIKTLYLRITGIPLEEESSIPNELMALWDDVYSIQASTASAWAAVVTAVLRDPAVVFY